ncbi:MAG: restriction endonuclease [Candidatus Thiodiazotropha sp.]
MDWKDYEKEIVEYFKEQYTDAAITLDAREIGRYSQAERQIDILVEQDIAGNKIIIAIDGKYFNKKVDVKAVESYIGMLEDIGAHKGLLISKEGFTEAAYNRAHFGPTEVELDILNFKDLYHFQAYGAIPYAGNNGARISAPFGWVVDIKSTNAWLATLYRQGLTLEEAMKENEFMYIQFWDRKKDNDSLSDLLKIQEEYFLKYDPECTIEFLPTIERKDAETILRVADAKSYPALEYTGFVEFDDFILFCVLFTPLNRTKSNIRKVENIMETVLPIKVQHQKANQNSVER